jgi:hypothetical protein
VPTQAIGAMAVMCALTTMLLIIVVLRFWKPTRLVMQIRQETQR